MQSMQQQLAGQSALSTNTTGVQHLSGMMHPALAMLRAHAYRQLLAPLQGAHCVAELIALAEVAAEEALLLLLARVHVAPLVDILVTLQAQQTNGTAAVHQHTSACYLITALLCCICTSGQQHEQALWSAANSKLLLLQVLHVQLS
jgi:hypothetical protein